MLIYQSTYIKKIQPFDMDKTHSLSSPILVIRSLDVKNDLLHHYENGEELYGPELPYFSAIGALMHLFNCTHPYIDIFVNLLVRYSSTPT